MAAERPADVEQTRPELSAGVRIAVTVLLVALLAVAGVAFFSVDVCDQQLTRSGRPVRVCRHLQATDPPIVGIGIASLALLSVFFSEISGFGFTFRPALRRVEQKTDDLEVRLSQNVERLKESESDRADLGRIVERSEIVSLTDNRVLDPEIRSLAEEYNRTRLTMPSGHERTRVMEGIVNKMIAHFRDDPELDIRESLQSPDRGLRLAGFAYLYARPEPRRTSELVDALVDREDKPFGQYWALRALRAQCQEDPSALTSEARRRLTDETRFPPGTDRANQLQRLLEECG